MSKQAIIQLTDKVRTVVRSDGTMPDLLYDLLTTPTPHGHEANLHKYLPFMQDTWTGKKPTVDTVGNIILDIGEPKKDFRTVFSCHLDTVHVNADAKVGLMYTLQDGPPETEGMIYAFTTYTSKDGKDYVAPSILGADDKLGIFIMLKLIEKGVPGRYIFHVGEERGGIGSKHIATNTPEVLKHMRRAIAFDRMNYTDAISFQAGGRCCSTEFSTAMCNEINSHLITRSMQFKPDVRGVWTDTANYTKLVSECTNLSVGYFRQHSTEEHFDLVWFHEMLLPALLATDWESLVTARDKTAKEPEYNNNYGYGDDWYKNWNKGYNSGKSNSYDSAGLVDRVSIKDMTKDTPLYKIPKWHPVSGIPEGLPEGTLIRLAEGYINENQYKGKELATTIAALVNVIAGLKKSNKDMRRYIVKNFGGVFKDTSVKMNAMRRFINTYNDAKAIKALVFDNELSNSKSAIQASGEIMECVLDFNLLDETVSEEFLNASAMATDINKLMERMAISMYPIHASTPALRATFKNLVKTIKSYNTEPGFEKLFRKDSN